MWNCFCHAVVTLFSSQASSIIGACENSISRQRWGRRARFILPINWEQPPPRCDGYLTISRPVLHLSIQQSIHTSWLYPSTKDNWKILSPKTLNLCASQNRRALECLLFAFWAGSILLKEGPQMFLRQVHMKDIHCVHFLVTYSEQQHVNSFGKTGPQ